MYRTHLLVIGLIAVTAALAFPRSWAKETRDTVHHTFSGDKTLEVRNLSGAIKVLGDSESTIRVDAERIIGAQDERLLERARQDVKLDLSDRAGVATVAVDYPSGRHGFFDTSDYEVTYNFIIHLPRETALHLHTANGAIEASQISGAFDVNGVNGHVKLTDMAGAGSVSTVNGPAEVSFREAPKTACRFSSVNGALDITFPASLAADFTYRTVHGGVFTDFNTSHSETSGGVRRRSGEGFSYMGGGKARVGSGGPELSFRTVNGDIRIHKQTN